MVFTFKWQNATHILSLCQHKSQTRISVVLCKLISLDWPFIVTSNSINKHVSLSTGLFSCSEHVTALNPWPPVALSVMSFTLFDIRPPPLPHPHHHVTEGGDLPAPHLPPPLSLYAFYFLGLSLHQSRPLLSWFRLLNYGFFSCWKCKKRSHFCHNLIIVCI